ncbi:crossover junction endodeoxyribonuclease RuvC [Candidatus Parcubacteria bacterium]|nr:crossover junction endodeoxyribonuclease RuvC [Candidatus Parcubacteria bacterium]
MKILSVDPGYERIGIAVMEKNTSKEIILFSECFTTSLKQKHDERLHDIGQEIKKIIEKFSPDRLAIETLFFNTNQKTAMHVAEARGVILYEAATKKIPIFEYTPLQVKIAVTDSYGGKAYSYRKKNKI